MAEGGGQDSVGSAVCLDVGRAAADPSRRLPVRCVSAPARCGVCARAGTHAPVEIKKTARRRRTRRGCSSAVLAPGTQADERLGGRGNADSDPSSCACWHVRNVTQGENRLGIPRAQGLVGAIQREDDVG